jgi:hypothetical protein
MSWFSGESIFDRLLGTESSSPKNVYYHCVKDGPLSKYSCRIVKEGEHRIIPVYPGVHASMHQQILEGVLNEPVTVK